MRLDPSIRDGCTERGVVAFVLVGVRLAEVRYSVVKLVELPRYAEIATRSPARACARASVQPQSRAYTSMLRGLISSITADSFQSRSWRR
jgi:hypothetical protein